MSELLKKFGSGSVAAIGFALGLLACERAKDHSRGRESVTIHRGDRVVVEASAAEFYEAQVIDAEGSRLKVQSRINGNMATVQAGNVYRLPSETKSLANRAYAICNVGGDRWIGCRVKNSQTSAVECEDAQLGAYQLSWAQVLTPGALTELNLKRLFEKSAERLEFERDLTRAGDPPTLPGWLPIAGRLALVNVGGQWRLAMVLGERKGFERVRLLGTKHEIETPRSTLAAEPPYPLDLLRGSRFALLRPQNQSDPWRRVRLVSADAMECTLEDYELGRRTAPIRDVCPLTGP